MAIRPGGVARATFRALGGSSSSFRPDQIALFEGSELDVTTILNNRYDRHARALTANVVLWPRPTTLVINRKAYDALTSEQQELLRNAARETFEPLLETLRSEEENSLAALCQEGRVALVNASSAERAALRKAVQPVYDELERDSLTRELIAEIKDLRRGLPPSRPLHCEEARTRTAPTPLDGVWRADLSAESLAAAGASKQEIELIQGPMRLELEAGRWTARMTRSGRIFRGSYDVSGSALRLVVGSCSPPDSCMNGQVTEYRWSFYRGKLSLLRSRGYVYPALVAEPWRRAR